MHVAPATALTGQPSTGCRSQQTGDHPESERDAAEADRLRHRMSSGFSAQEEDLFFQTGEAVCRQLRGAQNPASALSTIRQALTGFDRAYTSAPAAARRAVACRAGCDTCCHELVAAQAHEVLIAAEYVQTHFSPSELENVIARAAAHRAAFVQRAHLKPGAKPTPCVLLRDGSCSIYEARPESCRSHHSRSAEACRQNLMAGADLVDVHIRGLRGRMFAVMLGIDHAAVEAHFDGHAYDFGSALHDALTDSFCAVRWQQHLPAFAAECREEPDPSDPDAGEMRPAGLFPES